MRLLGALFIFLMLFNIAIADSDAVGDLPPEKGGVTKNIHIVFDQSGSMTEKRIKAALEQTVNIIAQAFDEFNLKVSVFADNSVTLIPGDGYDILEEDPSWMTLPSATNLNNVLAWLQQRHVIPHHTKVIPSMLRALADNTEDITIIVISDCIFDDTELLSTVLDGAQAEREEKKGGKAHIGFVNIGPDIDLEGLYDIAKDKGWFLIHVGIE